MDTQFSEFTPDITPIMLAAHTNNYEIIKLLVQKRVTIPRPHQIRCNCVECVSSSEVDSLRHSRSRLNIYKALASPSLIALSSEDPILTAFRLGWELKELSKVENEFKAEYEELSQQCKLFAKDLLDQARSSRELEIILNHRDDHSEELDPQKYHDLAKLKVAIKYHQKEVSWDHLWFLEAFGVHRIKATLSIFLPLKTSSMCAWLGIPLRPICLWNRQLLCSFFLTKKVVTWFFERKAFYHSTNVCQGLFSGYRILRRGETAILLVWRCFKSLTLVYLGTKFIKIMVFRIYIIIWRYLVTDYFTVKSFLYVRYETI